VHFLSYSVAGTVIVQLLEKRMGFSLMSLFRVCVYFSRYSVRGFKGMCI